ncbi:putative 2-aminoethylphosphonate ABC transporter substrate-binding protein [Gottschalkiaceae bacterium SANA]|nr:putative 2-aminoethylphosphonate ABC transporter substrate-binding protein [Gottschalkiaceae bacterium SANA]
MKKITLLAITFTMAITLSACSQAGGNTSPTTDAAPAANQEATSLPDHEPALPSNDADNKILVYLSGPEAMINKIEGSFEEQHGDVLDMTIMSCGQLRSKVWTESQAGDIQADVVWGSDPLVYNKLDKAGKLMPLSLENSKDVKDQYLWQGKNYALASERYIIIMYNNSLLKEEAAPTSFAELAADRYKGLVVKADASQSSTAFAISSALYELEGRKIDYFKRLKANEIMLMKSNGLVPSTIMEGQFALGIAPHDAVVRLSNKGKTDGFDVHLGVVWPSEGVIAIQRPVAIPISDSRSEQKQKTSMEFVNFLLSKKAQTIMHKFGFISIRKDIENTYLPEDVNVFSVDWDTATANEESLKNEYQKIFH